MKAALKHLIFDLAGKDPEAVVVSFLTGDAERARSMVAEICSLLPDRRHFMVTAGPVPPMSGVETVVLEPGDAGQLWLQLHRRLRRYRIGMAPVLLDDPGYRPLRRAAFAFAPGKVLAFNGRGERHHLQLRTAISSLLFVRGVPLDRIHLRPRWLVPWSQNRTTVPAESWVVEGRSGTPLRPTVGVLSPYLPWPLAHGGAVRIYNLLREASREFDICLLSFAERAEPPDVGPLAGFCRKIVVVAKPELREPRWATWRPPEVVEYETPAMRSAIEKLRREEEIRLLQVEYTQLAPYGGDILVEHDVTQDLYRQVWDRTRTTPARWDWWRWRRFENRAVTRYARVVTMSDKDAALLATSNTRTIANGVDLDRYRPGPERPGRRFLFIGSFRHFPNVVAYRYLVEEIWPLVRRAMSDAELIVVAGPDPKLHWANFTGTTMLDVPPGVRLLEFVADVRPLYDGTNVVLVPTRESAGTNIKVLEAMAMKRAVVSTASGCAGLGLKHGRSVWIADSAESFAAGIRTLCTDAGLRRQIAAAARRTAEQRFGWDRLGGLQRSLWRELAGPGLVLRRATTGDLAAIAEIQSAAPTAAQWEAASYLDWDCRVAEHHSRVVGFIALRSITPDEREILNVAVDPAERRQGIGKSLVAAALEELDGRCFLEVRESNQAAIQLYQQLGFSPMGVRRNYYQPGGESAIVLEFQSC